MSLSVSPLQVLLPFLTPHYWYRLCACISASSVCYTQTYHTIQVLRTSEKKKKSRIETADQPTISLVSLTLLWTPSDWSGQKSLSLVCQEDMENDISLP